MFGKKKKDTEDDPKRVKWAHPAEFVLSGICYAVGLGNVWRFPFLCYVNGGGAFLVPYIIMLVFVGIPMFFCELSLGQFSSKGTYHIWDLSPLFRGVGVGMLFLSSIGVLYYNQVVGWSVYFMIASLARRLPWDGCRHDYNTAYCYSKPEAIACETENGTWFNQTCYNDTNHIDYSIPANLSKLRNSSAEEYFNYVVLNRTPSIDETGTVKWDLALCLLLVNSLLCLCIIKGIRTSGKVAYFTAIFPYAILTTLVIRGCLLDGALEGIKFYLLPDWKALISARAWVDAAGQIFFSLSIGSGGLLTLASYNNFHNNVHRDSFIVTISNCLTSFYAGFAIFSVLGFMAKSLGQDISEVAKSGSGLAFIVYPEVVTHLPLSQFWSFLFFFMLLLLGLDSEFAATENIATAIADFWPKLRNYKPAVAVCVCSCIYLGALTTCTQAGAYWVDLMSYYVTGWAVMLVATLEITVVGWFYGVRRVKKEVELMLGFSISRYWMFAWKFTCPIILAVIAAYNMADFKPVAVGDYVLADWAQILGWLMTLTGVVVFPIGFAITKIIVSAKEDEYRHYPLLQRIWRLTQPSEAWKSQVYDGDDIRQDVEMKMVDDGLFPVSDIKNRKIQDEVLHVGTESTKMIDEKKHSETKYENGNIYQESDRLNNEV